MKRTIEEVQGVDIAVHAQVCLKYFQLVVDQANVADQQNVKVAVSVIYEESSKMLQSLIQSNSLEIWQSSSVESSSSSGLNNGHFPSSSGLSIVKDLILTTSFICSNSYTQSKEMKSDFVRKATVSPLSVLISLSPFWAISTLLIQLRATESEYNRLRDALYCVLCSKITRQAHIDITEEILVCSNQLGVTKNVTANALLMRIKKSLRTQLKNVLFYTVLLSVSLHSELTNTFRNPSLSLSADSVNSLLSHFDDNCIDVVNMIVTTCPQLALVTDTGSVGATPLAYAAAYRAMTSESLLEYKLSLGICKVLTEVAPSALALADRLGMLPLHHAAKRGHSVVMEFLSQHFHFTIPLKDSAGKTPLHHAILSSKQHDESSILRLSKLCPRILKESQCTSFEILSYAEKHCSQSLFSGLAEIYQLEKKKIFSQIKSNSFLLTQLQQRQKAVRKQQQTFCAPLSPTTTNNSFSEMEDYSEEESDGEIVHSDSNDSQDSFYSSSISTMTELKTNVKKSNKRVHEDSDEELLQYADTLLMLQSAKYSSEEGRNKKPKLSEL